MEIYYTTTLGELDNEKSPLGYIAKELYLEKLLIIGEVYPVSSVISGRLILAKKAIPCMYSLRLIANCQEDLLYKAHVHNIEARLAPYGVIYKDENVTIQAKNFEQKIFEVYKYKNSWLLK